jgi:hypothetical protein
VRCAALVQEKTGLIPGIDFARSLMVAVDVNHVEALLNTVRQGTCTTRG